MGPKMKWLPTLIAVMAMLATTFAPQIQHLIAVHPEVAAFVGGLYAIMAHFAPQPHK